MSVLRSWFRAMAFRDEGWMTLSNMLFDYMESSLDKHVIDKYIREVARKWWRAGTKLPTDPMRAVAMSDPDTYLCAGKLVPKPWGRCSRVMVAEDFLAHNLKKSIALTFRGILTAREVLIMEKHGIKGLAKKQMRTANPFAWVTSTSELQKLIDATASPDRGRQVRNHLGLRNTIESAHLIEIRYPQHVCDTLELHTPTFIEGCPSFIYRSTSGPKGWGMSVHLESLSDGLPEAVHRPIPFTDAFKPIEIGDVSLPLASVDWARLKLNFKHPWSKDSADIIDPRGGSRAKRKKKLVGKPK